MYIDWDIEQNLFLIKNIITQEGSWISAVGKTRQNNIPNLPSVLIDQWSSTSKGAKKLHFNKRL